MLLRRSRSPVNAGLRLGSFEGSSNPFALFDHAKAVLLRGSERRFVHFLQEKRFVRSCGSSESGCRARQAQREQIGVWVPSQSIVLFYRHMAVRLQETGRRRTKIAVGRRTDNLVSQSTRSSDEDRPPRETKRSFSFIRKQRICRTTGSSATFCVLKDPDPSIRSNPTYLTRTVLGNCAYQPNQNARKVGIRADSSPA